MSAKDDVKADLSDAYDQLTRPDIEKVVQMLAQAPAGHAGGSVAAALRPSFPAAAQRLTGASDADQTGYMRVLEGAGIFLLSVWHADGQRPELAQVLDAIDNVDGDDQ